MSHLESLGKRATLNDALKKYKLVGRHVLALAQAAVDMTDELNPGECELLGVYVSSLNKCALSHGIHSEAAVKNGIDRKALPAAGGGVPRYGDERWRPVYAYVGALTAAPGNVSPAHISSLAEAGWSEQAVAQMTALVMAFNALNRMVDGFGLEGGPKAMKTAGAELAKKGYTGVSKSLRLG